ncbi:oxidoreductase [Actinocatenispora thailandica]|uniref:Oxidoreductase n=1 Tax=Actinocatenispora thailandica TaxID=227318 RepID=A0A7R7DLK0_9ACTN|nr:aldo/keto reductase [Actinocatenispora thailandica]BCJ33915.1 oxidoreductase [Actinocatenispora thailandica]
MSDEPSAGDRVGHASGTIRLAGKTVHRFGFGAMRLVGPGVWGEPASRGDSVRLVRRAVELGVDVIDTASVYGPHISEEIIRTALHPYPQHVLITTKGGQTQSGPGSYAVLGRPEYLRQECVLSMRRLGVDHIDLYQLHGVDPAVPFEDQIGELQKLQEEGKIGAIGLNQVTVDQITAAREIVDIASVQNQYSLTQRQHDDVLDHCTRQGIPFISWFPLDIGALAQPDGPLRGIAGATGATPAQLALAWLLARAENMVPIPGTTSIPHLEENVAAATVRLDPAHLAQLDALAA